MSEKKILANQPPEVQMTRRKFIKSLSACLLLSFVVAGLKRQLELIDGKPSQQIRTFVKLLDYIKKEGLDNDKRNLIVAWIKFNLVAEWGDLNNYEFATRCVRHFLYGKGDLLAADLFITSLHRHVGFKGESPMDTMARIVGEEIQAIYTSSEADLPISVEEIRRCYESGLPKKVDLRIVTAGGGSMGPDFLYAMNRFTLKVSGDMTVEKVVKEGKTFMEVRIPRYNIGFNDVYDWLKGSLSETGPRIGMVLDNFLYNVLGLEKGLTRLKTIIGEEIFSDFYNTRPITIKDGDGALLVAHDFAHSFRIKGGIEVTDPNPKTSIIFRVLLE